MDRTHLPLLQLLAVVLIAGTTVGCSAAHRQPAGTAVTVAPPPAPPSGTRPNCAGHSHCVSRPDSVRPLFVVDGTIYDPVADSTQYRVWNEQVDPNQIESLEVMKGVHAVERFGQPARHGVVIIRMKGQGGKCLASTRWLPEPVDAARSIAHRFTGVDTADIVVEQDSDLCHDMSRLLGRVEPGPAVDGAPRPTYADVVVVRIGRKGYLVHSPWHSSDAGEFHCDKAIVLPDRKSISWLCS